MGAEFNKALAAFQAELPHIGKGKDAKIPGKEGRQGYAYKYADLEDVSAAVMPLLGKHGLAFTAWPTLTDGRFVLAYTLLHESGESRDGEYPLPSSATPHLLGSALTYARRYCLCAVTGAAPGGEDDDAAAATEQAMDRPRDANGYRWMNRAQDVPPDKPPRTPAKTTGAEHERLRAGTVEAGPDDRAATRGQLADEENPWQDVPAEELPGSANATQIRAVQMAYKRLTLTEREQALAVTEQIIRRKLTGPNDGRTHNNLSYAEAVKLKDTLGGVKTRDDLGELLAEEVSA